MKQLTCYTVSIKICIVCFFLFVSAPFHCTSFHYCLITFINICCNPVVCSCMFILKVVQYLHYLVVLVTQDCLPLCSYVHEKTEPDSVSMYHQQQADPVLQSRTTKNIQIRHNLFTAHQIYLILTIIIMNLLVCNNLQIFLMDDQRTSFMGLND